MQFTFQTNLSKNQTEELVLDEFKKKLNYCHFETERLGNRLVFKRKINSGPGIELIIQLFKGLTKGQIYFDERNSERIVCQLNYTIQMVVCLIVAFIAGVIFSWIQGFDWKDVLRIGTPVFLITFFSGVLIGNSRLKRYLQDAIDEF